MDRDGRLHVLYCAKVLGTLLGSFVRSVSSEELRQIIQDTQKNVQLLFL